MNSDELRALADALEPMARAPRFEDFDVPGFCAWVRACAEAKPVAWTARHTSVTRFALWLFINNALARSERAAQKGSYEPVENVAKYQDDAKTAEEARAMLAAAPAAPQAEPCIGNDSACPCQDGDACHYKDAADGTKAWPAPQAEPKREPLTDERIASVCLSYRHDFGLLSGDEQAGLMLEARAWERAFRKEWQRC